MYIPKCFEIKSKDIMYKVMNENSFATLVSVHHGDPFATHLPIIHNKDKGILVGHFARGNAQWRDIENQDVLVIFQGPHSYISPTWYETKDAVPTWNYVTVHVYGKVKIVENKEEIILSMRDMVHKYEGSKSKYQMNGVSREFLDDMMKGVVGFEISINKMEGKSKLSQNHPSIRQQLIAWNLEQKAGENDVQIAKLMNEMSTISKT